MAGRSRATWRPTARSGRSTRARARSCIARSAVCATAGLGGERDDVERRGPGWTTLAATRRGRTAFRRWRGTPVEHVRDLRSELMLKLLFHERSGHDPAPLLHAQVALLSRAELALEQQARSAEAFERTLVLWRLSVARAALSFVEALLDQRAVEPVVYRPIGLVVSPHTELDGMPLQPIADTDGESRIEIFEAHRGCLERPRRLLTRLDRRAPPRDDRLGRSSADLSRRPNPRHLRDALAATPESDRALAGAARRRRRPGRDA